MQKHFKSWNIHWDFELEWFLVFRPTPSEICYDEIFRTFLFQPFWKYFELLFLAGISNFWIKRLLIRPELFRHSRWIRLLAPYICFYCVWPNLTIPPIWFYHFNFHPPIYFPSPNLLLELSNSPKLTTGIQGRLVKIFFEEQSDYGKGVTATF